MDFEQVLKNVVDGTNRCFKEVSEDMMNVESGLRTVSRQLDKMENQVSDHGKLIFYLGCFGAIGGYYLYKKMKKMQCKIDEMDVQICNICDTFDANLEKTELDLSGIDDLK